MTIVATFSLMTKSTLKIDKGRTKWQYSLLSHIDKYHCEVDQARKATLIGVSALVDLNYIPYIPWENVYTHIHT